MQTNADRIKLKIRQAPIPFRIFVLLGGVLVPVAPWQLHWHTCDSRTIVTSRLSDRRSWCGVPCRYVHAQIHHALPHMESYA